MALYLRVEFVLVGRLIPDKSHMDPMERIGWKEMVDLPSWGIENIIAKADTGARRSAIDVKDIEELPGGKVRFSVVLHKKDRDRNKVVVAPIAHQTHVRSSNGQQDERYFVTTQVKLGSRVKDIELSLVCRRNMTCRMLIGRKALEPDFLVDSSQSFVTRPKRSLRFNEVAEPASDLEK